MPFKLPFGRGRKPARPQSHSASGASGQAWERPGDLPLWAEFFGTPEQLRRFEAEVGAYFEQRGIPVMIDDGMVTRANDPDVRYGLSNLGQACAAAPAERWRRFIADHFDMIIRSMEQTPDFDDSDLNALRERLVVRLFDVDEIGDMPLAGCEPIPGIFAALMVDEENAVRSVHPETAASWGVGAEELLELALDNVDRLTEQKVERVELDDAGVAYLAMSESVFGSGLVCRVDRMDDLVGPHGALVAVPVRNMFLSVPIHGPEVIPAVGRILPLVHGAHADGPGSVSRRLYWFIDGKWTELPWALEEGKLRFMPPPEFVEMLNGLVQE
ncbi:MAG: hypothetical protein ACF8R7_17520 [Phycisphaerales bacterium JB039]